MKRTLVFDKTLLSLAIEVQGKIYCLIPKDNDIESLKDALRNDNKTKWYADTLVQDRETVDYIYYLCEPKNDVNNGTLKERFQVADAFRMKGELYRIISFEPETGLLFCTDWDSEDEFEFEADKLALTDGFAVLKLMEI